MIILQDLKTASNKNGDNYFDSNTLRFFNSTISNIKGEKGKYAYFIETIADHNHVIHKIRKFIWINDKSGKVEKRNYGVYTTLRGAENGLSKL